MNLKTYLFSVLILTTCVFSAGCGSSAPPQNPEVAPTKAVLGNPSSLKIGGKPVGGVPVAPGANETKKGG